MSRSDFILAVLEAFPGATIVDSGNGGGINIIVGAGHVADAIKKLAEEYGLRWSSVTEDAAREMFTIRVLGFGKEPLLEIRQERQWVERRKRDLRRLRKILEEIQNLSERDTIAGAMRRFIKIADLTKEALELLQGQEPTP